MTGSPTTPDPMPSAFLSDADEMSLAASRAAQGPESVPDTLAVRSDSIAVMQGTMDRFRRPAVIAVSVVGVAIAILIAGGALRRMGRGDVTPME
mgnify:CR=1 FL=1